MNETWKQDLRSYGKLEPPTTLRDRIESGAREASPTPPSTSGPRRVATALVALALGAAGLFLVLRTFEGPTTPRGAGEAQHVTNGKIAFVSDGIKVVNPDGTGLQTIYASRGVDASPVWSPDGTRLAFLHNDVGARELMILELRDGTVVDLPADETSDVDSFAWSPDGTRIAFVTGNEVIVADADGSNATRVAEGGGYPTWSHNGAQIAYQTGTDIIVANVDGSEPTIVAQGFLPAWSPASSTIAFVDNASLQIGVVRANGTGRTILTDIPNDNIGGPAWSPDGSTIAFEVLSEGDYDIYAMGVDGTNVGILTDKPGDENVPTWSPDGMKIAFIAGDAVSDDPGNTDTFDLYVMNADGTAKTRLTEDTPPAYALSWQGLRFSPVLEDALANRTTGMAFAEQLGVDLVGGPPEGCTDYVEVDEEGAGYCVTGILRPGPEVFVAGELLRGRIPSEAQVLEWIADAADPGARPSEPRVGAVFAHGIDPIAGAWSLEIDPSPHGPLLRLHQGESTAAVELGQVEPRPMGDWLVASGSPTGDALLLVQVVAPKVERAEIRLDDGSVIEAALHPMPDAFGDLSVVVAGFLGELSVEGQKLNPDGYVIAFDGQGSELGRRPLVGDGLA